MYNSAVNEDKKDKARAVLSDASSDIEERIEAGKMLIEAYYERACFANKRFKTITFEEYAAMLLKASIHSILKFEGVEVVINELVKEFGEEDGLQEGTTYVFEDDSLNENDYDDFD